MDNKLIGESLGINNNDKSIKIYDAYKKSYSIMKRANMAMGKEQQYKYTSASASTVEININNFGKNHYV